MDLETRGHPLHTRVLTVTLRRGDGARREVAASLVDVRKRGFGPVGGDLQSSGIIHHMQVAAAYDAGSLVIERIETAQPVVAFEPSAVTAGECCRDPADRLQVLAGRSFDTAFPRALGREIGGPRGCTHVLTLSQLVASTVSWVARREVELFDAAPSWSPGERIFKTDLIFDAALRADGRAELAAQLLELHFRPAAERPRPMERFGAQLELRLLAEVDPRGMRLASVRAAERRRGPDDLDAAGWRDLAPRLDGLEGQVLGPGVSGALVRHFAAWSDERPLLDVMLNLTPAWYQALAAFQESWPTDARKNPGVVGMGGPPDSCSCGDGAGRSTGPAATTPPGRGGIEKGDPRAGGYDPGNQPLPDQEHAGGSARVGDAG